ncbi:MAG: NosD domain-containing protein, partial [Pseudomonadota bacterium]
MNSLADDASAADVMPGDGLCADSFNSCTLRAAIMEANALAGDDFIEFSVTGTIDLDSAVGPLPSITDYLVIDGTTAPGFNVSGTDIDEAPPVLIIDGQNLGGSTADGLRFSGAATSFSEIQSIAIRNFPDNGIESINAADSLIIQGCDLNGNSDSGIFALNTDFHVIGRTYGIFTSEFIGRGNLIANNENAGILLSSSNSNTLFGNFIGVLADETAAPGNDGNGLTIIGDDNVIGFFDEDEIGGNLIGGNQGHGLRIAGDDNTIYANRIGTGLRPAFFGNAQDGILITGSNNRIGAAAANSSNFIANNGRGIAVGSDFSSGFATVIENNRIGISTVALGNTSHGIHVESGDQLSVINNLVINNGGHGIWIEADDAIVRGNSIGVVGTQRQGNALNGVFLDGSSGSIIGGDDPLHSNIIGDNGAPGPPATGGMR